jgi:hypothetical protein
MRHRATTSAKRSLVGKARSKRRRV